MRHKAGDIVRVRPKEWMEAQEKNGNGSVLPPEAGRFAMVSEMQAYAGKPASVAAVNDGWYRLDADGLRYRWEDWMFEPDGSPAKRLMA